MAAPALQSIPFIKTSKTDINSMNLSLFKNVLTTAIGYSSIEMNEPTRLLSPVKSMMLTAAPLVSQPVIDELVRAVGAIAIAALSRWVVGWFEKKKKIEIVATVPIESKAILPVEKQPETLTINTDKNGNEKTQIDQ